MRRVWGGLRTLRGEYEEISGTCHVIGFYQVHAGAKDIGFAASRARILPLTTLARILKI